MKIDSVTQEIDEEKFKEIQIQIKDKEDALEVLHFLFNKLSHKTKCCSISKQAPNYVNQFRGSYNTCIKCNKCKNLRKTSEQTIALKILHHKNLEQDILNYFLLNESNDYECQKCTKANVSRFTSIEKTPDLLCICIIRNKSTKMDIPQQLYIQSIENIRPGSMYTLKYFTTPLQHNSDPGECCAATTSQEETTKILYNNSNNATGTTMLFYEIQKTESQSIKMLATNDRLTQIDQIIKMEHIPPSDQANLKGLLNTYNDIFCLEHDTLTSCPILKDHIKLYTDTTPINIKQYRRSKWETDEINRQVEKLLHCPT